MSKKKEMKQHVVGVATVTAILFYEKPKMKRLVTSRIGFCMEDMESTDKGALSITLKKIYKEYIDGCISRNEIPPCDSSTYRCTFRLMECDAILNKSNE